jgi:hypothetical protein
MVSAAMKKLLLVAVPLVVIVGGAIVVVNVAFDQMRVNTHVVAKPVREIVVNSARGDTDLVPGDDRIEVRETQHYAFIRPQLRQDVTDGVLTLNSDCEGRGLKCYADLRVTVPPGIKVVVDADSGDVDARGIDVRNAHLQSHSGDVRLELVGRQQLVWAHTDSGDIDAAAADAHAIDAQTDSGDVIVDAGRDARRVVARTDSGDVAVSVPAGQYAVDAQTDTGDVTIDGIMRNDGAPKSIQARTDSGDITLRASRQRSN